VEKRKNQATAIIAHSKDRPFAKLMLQRCIESIKREGVDDILVVTEGNKSECRNKGALKEKTKSFILFFDDDTELKRNCVEELLAPFDDEKVGVVGGVNITFPNVEWEEEVGAVLLSSPLLTFRSSARYTPRGDIRESDEGELLSAVMAVRKKAFEKSGGFPLDCIPCEENVLINNISKLGYKIIYNPFAVVYHRRPKFLIQYCKTIFNYGKGRGIMMRTKGGKMKMIWKPNLMWVAYIVGGVAHYISYISGLVYGLIKANKGNKENDGK
jgi:hypothetical protein